MPAHIRDDDNPGDPNPAPTEAEALHAIVERLEGVNKTLRVHQNILVRIATRLADVEQLSAARLHDFNANLSRRFDVIEQLIGDSRKGNNRRDLGRW